MKIRKLVSMLLSLTLVVGCLALPAYAQEAPEQSEGTVISEKVEQVFPDGSYVVSTVRVFPDLARIGGETSGSKTATCYNSSGRALGAVTVNGSFYFDGIYSRCVAATGDYSVYASGVSASGFSAYPSGSSAIATVTFSGYTISAILTCSGGGSLS